jgi:hypothetical protein
VVEASFVGTIGGFASIMTVRVLVEVLPQVSVATCVVLMTKSQGGNLSSEKIPQTGEFNNMRCRENRAKVAR